MPSQRDPQEPQDPIEDDDLIGAGEDDADEADEADEEEEDDEDILDEEEDDELDEDEDAEAETEEESDEYVTAADRESLTGEVGSEGGSPGEIVERTHDRAGLGRGSEATTTWEGGDTATRERRDDEGVPVKRAP
jgi:hypothetical protein